MPKVSEFQGIAIYVYYRETAPAHFHALHGGEEALLSIEDFSVSEGGLSPRALGLVAEWTALHQDELREVWRQARACEPLNEIEPLR